MERQAISRADRARLDAGRAPGNVFVDTRPAAVTLRKLSDAMHDSPRMASQRKLTEAMHASPRVVAQRALSDAIVQRHVKVAQLGQGASVEKPIYTTWTAADAGYSYAWDGRQVNASSENESEPVGFARYSIENIAGAVAPPAADKQYTFDTVKMRKAGRVAHLTKIENNTLTRDGPADIYRGFATTLMQKVEAKAREEGAWMIYLEPSSTPCRKNPANNTKEAIDPTGFYQKLGYGYDDVATAHNNAFVDAQFADLSAENRAVMKKQMNAAALGGVLQKLL